MNPRELDALIKTGLQAGPPRPQGAPILVLDDGQLCAVLATILVANGVTPRADAQGQEQIAFCADLAARIRITTAMRGPAAFDRITKELNGGQPG